MMYTIWKNNPMSVDPIKMARYERVIVLPSGDLECRDGFGEPVELVLARGQWDSITRDEY